VQLFTAAGMSNANATATSLLMGGLMIVQALAGGIVTAMMTGRPRNGAAAPGVGHHD